MIRHSLIVILIFSKERGEEHVETQAAVPAPATSEVLPLTDVTNQAATDNAKDVKNQGSRLPRERRERGPPADGIPSKNKVMVANLPYDLSEEKVSVLISIVLLHAHLVP